MLALTACSSPEPPAHLTQDCAAAAANHATLEIQWILAAAEHTAAYFNPDADPAVYAQIEADALALRIDTIIAEAATRHHCY